MTSLSFSAPSHGAGPFLALPKKGRRRLGAGGGDLDNILLSRLPCDARRTAAAPNSHIHVLGHAALAPPFGCASRHRQRRRLSLRCRPSMACTGRHGTHFGYRILATWRWSLGRVSGIRCYTHLRAVTPARVYCDELSSQDVRSRSRWHPCGAERKYGGDIHTGRSDRRGEPRSGDILVLPCSRAHLWSTFILWPGHAQRCHRPENQEGRNVRWQGRSRLRSSGSVTPILLSRSCDGPDTCGCASWQEEAHLCKICRTGGAVA